MSLEMDKDAEDEQQLAIDSIREELRYTRHDVAALVAELSSLRRHITLGSSTSGNPNSGPRSEE